MDGGKPWQATATSEGLHSPRSVQMNYKLTNGQSCAGLRFGFKCSSKAPLP